MKARQASWAAGPGPFEDLRYLITGGAGFIGCQYADRILKRGGRVIVFDNFSRPGAKINADWLQQAHSEERLEIQVADVRNWRAIRRAVNQVDIVVHLAAQTAVTHSLEEPWDDFTANAAGTVNVVEAARLAVHPPLVLYASTNKVYGSLRYASYVTRDRYRLAPVLLAGNGGIAENHPLDPRTPYACSKAAGEAYVLDYARSFGLRTVVMRQSCIYGPRQFGTEGQGWIAWLMIAALMGWPITVYGDGRQVRDVLYINDLLDAYDAALARILDVSGEIYNIGGGPDNTLSVWGEFGPLLAALLGPDRMGSISASSADWRPGDQRIYISDITKAGRDLGWSPKFDIPTGLDLTFSWIREHLDMIGEVLQDGKWPAAQPGPGRGVRQTRGLTWAPC